LTDLHRINNRINTAIIILAAGLSRRMGVFKPLLPVEKQPAVARCVHTAQTAGIRDIIVVTGHLHEEIEGALRANLTGIRIVHNSRYPEGMFSSVHSGVSALPEGLDGFFLLPADCCAISPDTLRTLTDKFAKTGAREVVCPKFEGRRGHPPLIPARHIGSLLSYNGENGMKGFLSPLPTIEMDMDGPDTLLDMDTPADYAALLMRLGLPTYPDPVQCAELLAKYDTPPDIVEHGKHVAALALKIARLIMQSTTAETRDARFDMSLLESACLLHDIRQMEPNHAKAGMELLLREGYPKAAILVGRHMDLPSPAADIGEPELLYVADKLCRNGKYVKLEDTIRELGSRFPQNPEALAGAKRRMGTAQAIFDTLGARYGIGYKDFFR